jgi:hypothetical protein
MRCPGLRLHHSRCAAGRFETRRSERVVHLRVLTVGGGVSKGAPTSCRSASSAMSLRSTLDTPASTAQQAKDREEQEGLAKSPSDQVVPRPWPSRCPFDRGNRRALVPIRWQDGWVGQAHLRRDRGLGGRLGWASPCALEFGGLSGWACWSSPVVFVPCAGWLAVGAWGWLGWCFGLVDGSRFTVDGGA